MKNFFKTYWANSPKVRRTVGIILIIIGGVSIITPFTPVGFLLIIGLELIGVRLLFWDKLKAWYRSRKG